MKRLTNGLAARPLPDIGGWGGGVEKKNQKVKGKETGRESKSQTH